LQGTGPQITAGTVRARRLRNGAVGLIVQGTTQDSELTINPVIKPPVLDGAHDFAHGVARQDGVLNIGSINVTSGKIGAILGFHSAVLSGPIGVSGSTPINRIAFKALRPGASIQVGNDLYTLDVLTGIDLRGGPGIIVGRDLNWLNVGQDLRLNDGAALAVGRDLGAFAQPAKGTAPGGQGAGIIGDLEVGPGSAIVIGRDLAAPFIVRGRGTGVSRITIAGRSAGFVIVGGFTP
jgi:hypothetical protein